ncbi:hypothetical protein AB0B66_36795 [Catellatospora sp. NPDC049111]|uniref:hypothetical protein n=1 Tax=Catellatospora sp. NPDC049111 TaxID=3155271 RepID=UPI0033CD83DA
MSELCPNCKEPTLDLFDKSVTLKTFKCSRTECGHVIQFLKGTGGWELVAAGLGSAGALAAILEFFDVPDIDHLLQALDL